MPVAIFEDSRAVSRLPAITLLQGHQTRCCSKKSGIEILVEISAELYVMRKPVVQLTQQHKFTQHFALIAKSLSKLSSNIGILG
jgi:hypothetical protein